MPARVTGGRLGLGGGVDQAGQVRDLSLAPFGGHVLELVQHGSAAALDLQDCKGGLRCPRVQSGLEVHAKGDELVVAEASKGDGVVGGGTQENSTLLEWLQQREER